ncbi:MAG: hypothetical protein K2O04_01375, partial [Clostridiales bacterium]|nr:hypothetical protein [Clostridiales bacterium]
QDRKRSDEERKAIRRYYAKQAAKGKAAQQAAQSPGANNPGQGAAPESKQKFPDKFPFWARLKISKNRTTLVIDEDMAVDKKTNKPVDGFVHREATSEYHKGFEEIQPNPDKDKRPDPMYLKSPRKLPKYLFNPHNKQLDMPEHLRERYDKNNHKTDDSDGDK